MPKIKYRFSLSQEERDELRAIVSKGKHDSQKVLNALILLNYDEDASEPRTLREQEIANVLKVSEMKIRRIKQRFVEEGLDIALNGHERERVYKRILPPAGKSPKSTGGKMVDRALRAEKRVDRTGQEHGSPMSCQSI
jgi:Winged helix-turn helix